jgi:urea transporter
VLTYSWQSASFMLIGALAGPAVALVLKAERTLVELGLFGFNSCLMGLALGNFFERDAQLWVAVVALTVVTAVVAHVMIRLLKFPVLAAPFLLTFWVFWPVADELGLTKLTFPPFVDEDVFYLRATLSALGATLFAGTVLAGLLFFVGLLVSNWRHAVLAFVAALTAHTIAVWWSVPGEEINSGLAGLNAVLAAVAIYALLGTDVRLALLGAIFASAVLPLFGKLGLISLAGGFVLTAWLIIFLGWFQKRYFNEPSPVVATDP